MVARKQRFSRMRIAFDDCSFAECRFGRCHFVFHSYMGGHADRLDLRSLRLGIAGPTTALYGGGSQQLIESTVPMIRGEDRNRPLNG